MKCPHCRVEFHETEQQKWIANDTDASWAIVWHRCPSCELATLYLVGQKYHQDPGNYEEVSRKLIHPMIGEKLPAPSQVPEHLAEDFNEASLIMPFSANASAALARRCLQKVLRESLNVSHASLATEIQEVIDSAKLPPHINEALEALKTIAKFDENPKKSEYPGVISESSKMESEWLLDVLEVLFDFYYVQPVLLRQKRESLNLKLKNN
jgi:hypothetical protein